MKKKILILDIITFMLIISIYAMSFLISGLDSFTYGALIAFVSARFILEGEKRNISKQQFEKNKKIVFLINILWLLFKLSIYFIVLLLTMMISIYAMFGALTIFSIYRSIFLVFLSKSIDEGGE